MSSEHREHHQSAPPTVAAAIKGVRRARRRVRRASQEAAEALASQILAYSGAPPTSKSTYTIDELALKAGTTSRNIRAYRERGLLAEPGRHGRRSMYDDSHLDRLTLIVSLLKRGFTIAHVSDLLTAADRGQQVSDFLGSSEAAGHDDPRQSAASARMTAPDAARLLGSAETLHMLADRGLLSVDGDSVSVRRPHLIDAFVEAKSLGIRWETMLAVYEQVDPLVQETSRLLVEAGVARVREVVVAAADAPDETTLDLGWLVHRLRVLSVETTAESLRIAVDRTIRAALTGALTGIIEEFSETDTDIS